jgi:hypothetical protein
MDELDELDESVTKSPEEAEKVKDVDHAQYQDGVQACLEGEPFNAERSPAWQLGWECCRREKQDKQ